MWRRSELVHRLRRVPRVAWLLAAVTALALPLLAWRPGAGQARGTVEVARGDLVLTVEVEGELAAVRSREIGVPPVARDDFKIAFLAPEGSAVKAGDVIMRFDTDALQRRLAEQRAELAQAEKKREQKELELRVKLLDSDQQLAQARADLGKAALKADVPAEVQQRIELEKAALDRRARQRDLENTDAERRMAQALAGSELGSLLEQRERAAGRVRELERTIEAMAVRAPLDGIVVYRANWRDEKKKVGDSVWFGEKVLSLPDLSEMKAEGFVDEADGGALAEGLPVVLRLEARPDIDLPGKLARIGRTVQQRSWRAPGKGFRVEIGLARTDPTFMRPAMRFRGEIETGRIPGVLLVPREAVALRPRGPVVWVRRALGWREVAVKLGRRNRSQVEVLAGLAAGDRVSSVDLAAPRDDDAVTPAGGAGS